MDKDVKQWLEDCGLTDAKEAREIQKDLWKIDGIYVEDLDYDDFLDSLELIDYSYGGSKTRVACLPKFPDDRWGEGWEREAALEYFQTKYPTSRLGLPFATYRYWCQRVFREGEPNAETTTSDGRDEAEDSRTEG